MSGATRVQRILAHMNRDHKLALEDYLYVYGGVPLSEHISNVRLLSIDLECLTLQFQHVDVDFDIEKTILLQPPLKDLSEAKERLISMAQEAAKKRHLSCTQVNDMSYPSQFGEFAIIAGILLLPLCYKYRQVLYWLPIPTVLKQFLDSDFKLMLMMILVFFVHLLETLLLLKPRLEFYRVPTDFLIEWYLFGLIEGYAPVRRLEKLARDIESTEKKSPI